MPRLFVRKAAKADVAEAFSWYDARRTGLGLEFVDEISVTYEAIEEQPRRFPTILDDIQMAVVHRFPYLIYFVELQNSRIRPHRSAWSSRPAGLAASSLRYTNTETLAARSRGKLCC